MIDRALVFATGYFGPGHHPSRYETWCRYYGTLFEADRVDLMIVADGDWPITFETGPVTIASLAPHLGRPTHNKFPGFRRSFGYGVQQALVRGYRYLAHVESDCYIRPRARPVFLEYLFGRMNAITRCPKYDFLESALMVLNTVEARSLFVGLFGGNSPGIMQESLFEYVVDRALARVGNVVTLPLTGDRAEGRPIDPAWDYAAQADYDQALASWPEIASLHPAEGNSSRCAPPSR